MPVTRTILTPRQRVLLVLPKLRRGITVGLIALDADDAQEVVAQAFTSAGDLIASATINGRVVTVVPAATR